MSEMRDKLSTIAIVRFTAFNIPSEECFFDMNKAQIDKHLNEMCNTVIIYSYVFYNVKLDYSALIRRTSDEMIFDKLNQNTDEKE